MRFSCTVAMLCASMAHAQTVDPVVIGTGQRGSIDYSVGGAICRVMNRADPYGCAVLPTNGATDNLYALSLGDVNFAIVPADLYRAARFDQTGVAGDYTTLRIVASVYTESLTVITRADSNIMRLSDLRGRRVAAGGVGSASRWTFLSVLNALGMGVGDLGSLVVQRDAANTRALCSGELDAVVVMTGHPSMNVSRMAQTCPIRFIAPDVDEMRAVIAANPSYRPVAIPPGIYPSAPGPVPSIGTEAALVTDASTRDEQVGTVLTAIFGDVASFRRQQNVLAPRPLSRGDDPASYHPAALRFYRSRLTR